MVIQYRNPRAPLDLEGPFIVRRKITTTDDVVRHAGEWVPASLLGGERGITLMLSAEKILEASDPYAMRLLQRMGLPTTPPQEEPKKEFVQPQKRVNKPAWKSRSSWKKDPF